MGEEGVVEGHCVVLGDDFGHARRDGWDVGVAGFEFGFGESEGLVEAGGDGALFGGEVGVAAAHGEAVGFTDGGAGDDLDGGVEVFDHLFDDGELLVVF